MSKFFKLKEFECKCGCGLNNVAPELIEKLDTARSLADIPFIINSGCRCTKHNADIGGSESSSHLGGFAVDLKCKQSVSRFLMIQNLIKAGFNRIGLSKDFIHVDIDSTKTPHVFWVY